MNLKSMLPHDFFEIMKILMEKPLMTSLEISEKLGKNPTNTRHQLRKMRKDGFIVEGEPIKIGNYWYKRFCASEIEEVMKIIKRKIERKMIELEMILAGFLFNEEEENE